MILSFLVVLAFSQALDLIKVLEPIDNEYIVLFNQNVSKNSRENHMNAVGGEVFKRYDFPGYAGYAARINDTHALQTILDSPLVKLVEQNGQMHALDEPNACVTQVAATWGLVRTSVEDRVLSGEYTYEEAAGTGVIGYILDTGIYIDHNDFENRAVWGYNAMGDGRNSDYNGHGTHVAGTMCGKLYGLSKKSTCKAVKVLGDSGSGSYAGIIDGIDWVVKDAIENFKRANKKNKDAAKGVGNMSLGGGKSQAVNDAVDAAHEAGVLMAAAAGNSYADACNFSPASAAKVVSTGASDSSDAMASFSNWGSCVDIFGPGVSITSAWINGVNSDNTISGTSMASPHVAGVAMKLMWQYPEFDSEKIKTQMLDIASTGKISGVRGSPNKLTYHGCLDA